MIDWHRASQNTGQEVREERVQSILYDPNRSAKIALLAGEEHKRYIIATKNMEVGQIVKSSKKLSTVPGIKVLKSRKIFSSA